MNANEQSHPEKTGDDSRSKGELKGTGRRAWLVFVVVAAIAPTVALFTLAWQLRQQNSLERKRVETTYLLKALDVVHTPTDILMQVAIDTRMLDQTFGKIPEQQHRERFDSSASQFQTGIRKYSDAMMTAGYFAELIEPESTLRRNGMNQLFASIRAAEDASVALIEIAPAVRARQIPVETLAQHPRYRAADAANREAAKTIVRRLQELYGNY